MLGVMIVLLGLVFLWLAVVAPINAARVQATQRLDSATADAARLDAIAADMRHARASASATIAPDLGRAIRDAADAGGFTLSRLDAQGPDRFAIGIPAIRSPALFGWLRTLDRQGIIVDRITLRTNSDATLSVDGIARARGR